MQQIAMTSDGLTYYELLQVSPDASPVVIDASFRALMKIHHPDRGGDHSRTKDLLDARSVLLDETRRRQYDLMLSERERQKEQPPPPRPRPAPPTGNSNHYDTPDPDAGAEAHEQFKRQIGHALEILGPFVLILILLGLLLLAISGIMVN